MRIISGQFKGRRFPLPKQLKARPTTDFAKESLFNILNNQLDFEGLTVLDLFAGTGSIGLEFVSRGAASLCSVEQYQPHINFIRSVVEKLAVKNVQLIKGDVYQFINQCHRSFDVVFADAPYADALLPEIPSRVLAAGLLNPNGVLIVEHSKAHDFGHLPQCYDCRSYGSVHFSFFHP